MTKYLKIYIQAMGYDYGDFIPCEVCQKEANSVHHVIFRSQGGKDTIDNLIALCGNCHHEVHFGRNKNKELIKQIVNER